MNNDKALFSEQQKQAINLAELFNPLSKKKLMCKNVINSVFPNIKSIYNKPLVMEMETKSMSEKATQIKKRKEVSDTKEEIKDEGSKSVKSFESDTRSKGRREELVEFPMVSKSSSDQGGKEEPPIESKHWVYLSKSVSRFKFSEEETSECESIEIPQMVSNIVGKKLSKFSFFKRLPSLKERELDSQIYFSRYPNEDWIKDIGELIAKNPSKTI